MQIQILFNIILQFSIISLIGISFLFIFNTCKFYVIHHASIIVLGGYFAWLSYTYLGLSLTISLIISVFLTILIGLFIELMIFRNLRKKK